MEKINFHHLVKFRFTERRRLKEFLLLKLKAEGKSVETINYIFCNDAYLLNINKEYLNHDTYTDIITFELSPKDAPLLADIYISIERVKENAIVFDSSFKAELHRVIFHGALHLAGYGDKSKVQAQRMRIAEDTWLRKYFVPREISRAKD